MAECDARFVYRPEYLGYDFGPRHPLRPERIRTSLQLMQSLGIAPSAEQQLEVPTANIDELELVHDSSYVDAVQRFDLFGDDPAFGAEALPWGLGPGDTPVFSGMHAVSALIAGGTLNALRGVLRGDFVHAFNPAGGLHHALRDRASGFCVYNDAAIAIAAALREHEARVLYLDFDAHHGDGVQAAFYDEPRVLTFSIHETGRHLFPGTGFAHELGEGLGRGFSLNVPVEPFTEDASWLECLELLVSPIAEWFAPDVIVSQHGCDSHSSDPLTDLRLSTRAFVAQARLVHELAHQVAGGRWIALGGGGYDWERVVPRSWSGVWAEMAGHTSPEDLLDPVETWPAVPRRAAIERTNRARAEALRRLVLPAPVRHAYPAYRIDAAPPKLPDLVVDIGGDLPESRVESLESARGRLFLRDLCPPSLIQQMRPDPALKAFTRRAEREHAILQRVANSGRGTVAIAHTDTGSIVAQVVFTPADDWWQDLPGTYEVSVETSANWRRMGIGKRLLQFSMAPEWVEHLIVLAMGLDWHWDLAAAGLDAHAYRSMLRSIFETVGFQELRTSEPNIAMHATNLLLVRMGARVSAERQTAFREALYIAPWQRREINA
jgi:acetoin utilization deacetylase AcuC-like enzyme